MASDKKEKKEKKEKPVSLEQVVLTKEHVKAVQSIILSMRRLKMDQEALSEDIKGAASKMNVKPGDVKEMANWIMQEEDKGGVIDAKEQKLDMIRKLFEMVDNSPPPASLD